MGLFEPGSPCDQLGMLATVTHPIFEEHVRSAELVRLSRSRPDLGPGCTIGQHTVEILRDRLGYTEDQVSELYTKGIVAG